MLAWLIQEEGNDEIQYGVSKHSNIPSVALVSLFSSHLIVILRSKRRVLSLERLSSSRRY
jgi:hypothetical protein